MLVIKIIKQAHIRNSLAMTKKFNRKSPKRRRVFCCGLDRRFRRLVGRFCIYICLVYCMVWFMAEMWPGFVGVAAETRAHMALYYEIVERRTAALRKPKNAKMTRETSNLVAAYSCEHARFSRARYIS